METEVAVQTACCWDLCRGGDAQGALEEASRLHDIAVAQSRPECAAVFSSLIGWFCFQLGEIDTGLDHTLAAKAFWAQTADKERQAWTGAVHAWLLLEAGLTEEATDEAVKALALAEDAGNRSTLSWAMNTLGVIFWSCKQLERALSHCEAAAAIASSLGDVNLMSWWLINVAGVHSFFGYRQFADGDGRAEASLRLAVSINDEALNLARAAGDLWSLRIALANAAEYFTALGDFAQANQALDAWRELPGTGGNRTYAHFLYTEGQTLLKQGRLTEARSVCILALTMAKDGKFAANETCALRYLSEIEEGLGDFRAALDYFKRFYDAEACLAAERVQRRARFAEIHYETERFKRLAEAASRQADEMALTTMLDPLTGIGNRRRLDHAVALIRSEGARFALALLDLDRFKAINDTFSHMVGDRVLKRVALLLQSFVAPGDTLVRLGGEEFVMLWPGTDLDLAARRCEDVRARIADSLWADIDPRLRVTTSIGVAAGDPGTDPMSILALADARLYKAKSGGRNRVVESCRDTATLRLSA